jgi:hypothetical protein
LKNAGAEGILVLSNRKKWYFNNYKNEKNKPKTRNVVRNFERPTQLSEDSELLLNKFLKKFKNKECYLQNIPSLLRRNFS